jgi:hypothetical protein
MGANTSVHQSVSEQIINDSISQISKVNQNAATVASGSNIIDISENCEINAPVDQEISFTIDSKLIQTSMTQQTTKDELAQTIQNSYDKATKGMQILNFNTDVDTNISKALTNLTVNIESVVSQNCQNILNQNNILKCSGNAKIAANTKQKAVAKFIATCIQNNTTIQDSASKLDSAIANKFKSKNEGVSMAGIGFVIMMIAVLGIVGLIIRSKMTKKTNFGSKRRFGRQRGFGSRK